jgi:hypothetical protein
MRQNLVFRDIRGTCLNKPVGVISFSKKAVNGISKGGFDKEIPFDH